MDAVPSGAASTLLYTWPACRHSLRDASWTRQQTMTATVDPGSPELWLDQHGDALYGYAMLRVQEPALAEDLVQETLLAALAAKTSFAGRAEVRTWLIGILKNKLIDHLRKWGREESFDATLIDDDTWAGKFDDTGHWHNAPARWQEPAFIAENAELGQLIMTCVDKLPEKYRAAFVLREIDGLDTDELIAVLAISTPGNLWVMLSRARERVRSCVERAWSRAS